MIHFKSLVKYIFFAKNEKHSKMKNGNMLTILFFSQQNDANAAQRGFHVGQLECTIHESVTRKYTPLQDVILKSNIKANLIRGLYYKCQIMIMAREKM